MNTLERTGNADQLCALEDLVGKIRTSLQKISSCSDQIPTCERETGALRHGHLEMCDHLAEAMRLVGLAQIELSRVEERLRIANLLADFNISGAGRVGGRFVADHQLFT